MEKTKKVDYIQCCVIGAGISGIAVARWLKYYNIDFTVLEKSDDIAGLWRFRNDDYGVMEFTHINVSKYNYCFSDHPFPAENADYPHHSEMYKYVKSYADKHKLFENIKFNTKVVHLEEIKPNDPLLIQQGSFDPKEKAWKISVEDTKTNEERIIVANYVSIASGHHGTPELAKFKGQETFSGEIIHSIKYKSAKYNNLVGKNVLIVGIGNSAVDIAVNLVNEGCCPKVTISTRSGAWIIPNYISGFATDLYACRAFFKAPWKISTRFLELVIKFIYGNPKKYNLNPKMRALQAQPTVSPTIVHHIQRNEVKIKPNIRSINGNEVTFENGDRENFDSIILCTGYKIDLSYLNFELRKTVFKDKDEIILDLYKQVFHPKIGHSLAFIGFVQPSSGGLLTCSEIQARWFVNLLQKNIHLPSEIEMVEDIEKDIEKCEKRFHSSKRHTIQKDPIVYNDEVSELFGAKPEFYKNWFIYWRLMFSSCGPAQWRLNGPEACSEATDIVKSVPVTDMMKFFALIMVFLFILIVVKLFNNPLIFATIALIYYAYKNYRKKIPMLSFYNHD